MKKFMCMVSVVVSMAAVALSSTASVLWFHQPKVPKALR